MKYYKQRDPVLQEIKIGVIILFIFAFIAYMLGSFVSASLNIQDWSEKLRYFCAFMFFIAAIFTLVFVSIRIDNLY